VTFWIGTVFGGLATYLERLTPLALSVRGTAPARLRRYLDALPIAIIAALAGAGIAVPDAQPTGGAEVVAAAVVFGLATWRRNLLLAMLAGVLVVAALRAAGL